jgi:hypothetical protein
MKNTFSIDYFKRELTICFQNEQFIFELLIHDKSVYWNNFQSIDGNIWTIDFNQADETTDPVANVYSNANDIKGIDNIIEKSLLCIHLELDKCIGDPELYFYTDQ